MKPVELNPVSAWLKPRSRWLVWPALLLALVVAFGAGAALAVTHVPAETRTEYLEVKRTVKVQAKTKEVIRYVKITTLPDGTKTEERSEREALKVDTRSSSETAITAKNETTSPNWRVGLQAGATWKEPALQIAGPLVIGVSVEGRIAKSPVSAGAWGSTFGAAGASLSIEF